MVIKDIEAEQYDRERVLYSTVRAFELVSACNEDKMPKGESLMKEVWRTGIRLT